MELLEKSIIEQFESEKKAWMKNAGSTKGIKFESTKPREWIWQWRQFDGNPINEYHFRGPTISKRSSKLYPLEGKFSVEYSEDGKSKTSCEVYYYDKIKASWSRTKPKE